MSAKVGEKPHPIFLPTVGSPVLKETDSTSTSIPNPTTEPLAHGEDPSSHFSKGKAMRDQIVAIYGNSKSSKETRPNISQAWVNLSMALCESSRVVLGGFANAAIDQAKNKAAASINIPNIGKETSTPAESHTVHNELTQSQQKKEDKEIDDAMKRMAQSATYDMELRASIISALRG